MKRALISVLLFFASLAYSQENGEIFTDFNGIVLNRSNLYEIQKRFGKGRIIESGDAGGYSARLNYYLPKEKVILRFISSELGGVEHDLIGFEVQQRATISTECTLLDNIKFKIEVGGIHLGMTKVNFRKLVGQCDQITSDVINCKFLRTEKINDLEIDTLININGQFKNNHLFKFSVYKTMTR